MEGNRSPKATVVGAHGRAGEGGVLGEDERARDVKEEDTKRIRGEKNHLLEASTHGAQEKMPPMINDRTAKTISLTWTIVGAVFLPALIIRK
jgi:hypothetical protein